MFLGVYIRRDRAMTSRRESHRVIHLVACVALIALSLGTKAKGQSAETNSFASIPAQLRPQFFEQLNLFIKLQEEKQWDKMYDLSLERLERSSFTREEFIKSHQDVEVDPRVSVLTGFSPTAATLVNQWNSVKEWLIEGCAAYRNKGKLVRLKAGLNAALSNGHWYFSYLSAITKGVDGPDQPCAPVSKKKSGMSRTSKAFHPAKPTIMVERFSLVCVTSAVGGRAPVTHG